MLRVGDFSLYGNNIGIAGIGELKTHREGDSLKVQAFISSPYNLGFNSKAEDLSSHIEVQTTTDYKSIPRLEKQLSAQDKLLFYKKPEKDLNYLAHFEYDLLGQMTNRDTVITNRDQTLLLWGSKNLKNSLYDRLSQDDEYSEIPKDFQAIASRMVVSDSKYNRFIIGSLNLDMRLSRIPIFWWDISDEICRDLYFHGLHISTVYNPAKIIQRYTDLGYTLSETQNLRGLTISKPLDGGQITLHEFDFFFDLISHSLIRTEYATEIIDQVLMDIEHGKYPLGTKIDMMIHLRR